MRYSYPPKRKPAMRGPYEKPMPIITPKQVRMLIVTAQKAYTVACNAGVDDGMSFDDWRKVQIEDEFHTTSFRKLRDRDFNRALNVFRKFTGEKKEEECKGLVSDIPYRKKALYLLRQNIKDAGVTPAYVKTIMERKFKMVIQGDDAETVDRAVRELHAHDVEKLAWTIKNRKANKEAPGSNLNRDKKQRNERATAKRQKRYYSLDDSEQADSHSS